MAEIVLTQGYRTIIDDADVELVSAYKWHVSRCGALLYAKAHIRIDDKRRHTYMHRLIVKAKNGQEVDHIDGNTLNNTRANLRLCSHLQNLSHRNKLQTNNKSGINGVHWSKKQGCWCTQIKVRG